MTFGERLVKAREHANLKQNQLAELLGITPSRLNYWEKDKREPDVLMLKKIAQNLNVSADYLIGNISNEEYSFAEQSLIKKYRLLSNREQAAVDNLINNLSQTEKTPAKIDYSRFKTAEEIMKEDHLIAKGGGKVNISKENLQKIIEKAKKDE